MSIMLSAANDGATATLWVSDEPFTRSKVASGITLSEGLCEISALEFDVYPGMTAGCAFDPYKTRVRLRDDEDTEVRFSGRVIGVKSAMDSDGTPTRHVTCESVEATLLDTTVDDLAWLQAHSTPLADGSFLVNPDSYVDWLLSQQVTQTIRRGHTKLDGYIYRGVVVEASTDQTIRDKLAYVFGQCFLVWRIRTVIVGGAEVHYLDDDDSLMMMPDTDLSVGDITVGDNMLACASETNWGEIHTVFIPLGDEYEDGNGDTQRVPWSTYYTTCSQSSRDLLASAGFAHDTSEVRYTTGVATYGRLVRHVEVTGHSDYDEDTHTVTVTQEQADDFVKDLYDQIRNEVAPSTSISVDVTDVDVAHGGDPMTTFRVGSWWRVVNSLIDLNPAAGSDYLTAVSVTTYPQAPEATKMEVGHRRFDAVRQAGETREHAIMAERDAALAKKRADAAQKAADAANSKCDTLESTKVAKTDYASTSNVGVVKPDGSTVTADADGTLHASGGVSSIVTHNVVVHANCQYPNAQTTDGVANSAAFATGDHSGYTFETKINLSQLKQLAGATGASVVRVVGIEDRHDYNSGYMVPKSYIALVKKTTTSNDVMTITYSMICSAPYSTSPSVTGNQSHFLIQLAVDELGGTTPNTVDVYCSDTNGGLAAV